MSDEEKPYPAWGENATKGDLIRAIVYLRANVTALASVIVAMRMNNEQDVQTRMNSFFDGSKELDRIMDEISGRMP